MMIEKYSYPIPNHGSSYLLSEPDLVNLLNKAYMNGFKHGAMSCTPLETTMTTTKDNIIIDKENDYEYI